MANTIFTQTITCLAVGKYPASNVDHPIHPLRFNSKLKHNNRLSVPEKNLALRFQNGSTRKMYVYPLFSFLLHFFVVARIAS